MAKRKPMKDERYFEGSTEGWMIATPTRSKPLLFDGQMPIFWHRSVAKLHLRPWMQEAGCHIVRVVIRLRRSTDGR